MLQRPLLRLSFSDARVLRAPTYSPILLMKVSPDEPLSARGQRSISRANIWGYSDACTGTIGNAGSGVNSNFCGVAGYIPGFAWFSERLSELSIMCIGSARFTDTNINVLELFALLTAATLAIEQLQSMQSSVGCHVHIYCDNVSAISKCQTHCSNHPVYTYLLHLLSLLQLRNRCTIGTSFLKGKENVVADAASRTFSVPRATVIYNRHLAQLLYHRLSGDSIYVMKNMLLTSPKGASSPCMPQSIGLVLSTLPSFVPVSDRLSSPAPSIPYFILWVIDMTFLNGQNSRYFSNYCRCAAHFIVHIYIYIYIFLMCYVVFFVNIFASRTVSIWFV
jgi:hypothetical protein